MALRAYYNSEITAFVREDQLAVLGALTESSHLEVSTQQRDAWSEQVHLLQDALLAIERGHILF